MKIFLNQKLKFASMAFLLSMMATLPVMADNVKLVNKPLVESSTSDVLPNLMYILDNSGSMNQNYTPDWIQTADFEDFNNVTERRIVSFTRPGLTRNAAINTQYYNPSIRYTPAVGFDGVSMPEQTSWTNVSNDAFATYYNTSIVPYQGLSANLVNSASYFSFVAGEHCTTAALTTCINSITPTATHTFPAPIRWCNTPGNATTTTPLAGTCRLVREVGFTNLRTPPNSTFTINVPTTSVNNTISSIKINGIEILSASASGNSQSNLRTAIRDRINACTGTNSTAPSATSGSNETTRLARTGATGNCDIAGHSATASGSTITVTSPAGTAIGPIVVTRTVGTIDVTASATSATRTGSLVLRDIVSTNNAYPLPGKLVSDADRSDCAGAVCTYSEEMTNYANWWTYYRTRMQGMKTSSSLAFKPIDNRYRVGFITINSPASNYLAVGKYEAAASQQKDQWYTKLFSTLPSGGTPLREALARVGRIYAKKSVGFTAGDPVEYACQPNFSLLTTDGYWNGNAGRDVNNALIGNLDGDEDDTPRPKFDGGSASASGTLADVAMYYYDTDIRTTGFSNCTGALGQNVCGEGVGNESIVKQNMTTLTLGLGIDGTLIYSNDYKTQTIGDFADIKSPLGIRDWPVPVQDTASAIDDLWHAAVNSNGTYFSARTPKELSDSLKKALADIQSKVGAGSAASASSLQPTAGDNFNYVASYETVKWVGNLEARTVNLTTLETSKSAAWCAENVAADAVQGILPCSGTMASKVAAASDTRNIKFNSGGVLVDFNYGNLNATQKSFFETTFLSNNLSQWPDLTTGTGGQREMAVGNGIVNFLRGQQGFEDRSSNAPESRIFRFRETTLGDITESQPAFISKPVFNYTDPGYDTFKSAQSGRVGRIYVGANDGMLHAFNAANGQEVWAFVPTPAIPKMWKLADRDYATNHVNLVNGDPTIAEICVSSCSTASATWKTVLVAGLSGGGRGYYALDITNPDTPQLLWEYTAQNNANLGYTFGSPVVTKLADGTWVALLTSGYNNGAFDNNGTTANSPAGNGQGYLYVVNVATGAVIKSFPTNQGSSTTPSGLGQVSAFVDDVTKNNLATYVYSGDLLGNLWRFDLNAATGTAPLQLATLKGPDGTTAQPITTAPQLGVVNKKRVIFVGTGKYLEVADLTNTEKQSLYAIKDDDLNTPLGNPRASLIPQVITTSGEARTATNVPVDFNTNLGWRVDFPDAGERMNIEPFLVNGVLLAPTVVPASTSCSPGGYGWFNFFNYRTGSSVIAGGVVSEKLKSPAVGFNLVYNADGKPVITVVESNNPTPQLIDNKDIAAGSGANRATLLNKNPDGTYGKKSIWRELIR
jgi:type IV pilus assembly protein PilY1